ncbi:phosphate acyltransferase PlsX [Gallicola sp. Sow4_E12]|uniref:phosphate acyltransferase PlsX n=1 Tax=Gallicola sp. Sow4_E12 TaxID=3438785 RepID=UPI003F92BC94
MKIIIDTLGADKGYEEVVLGTLKAMDQHTGFEVLFVGPENKIKDVIGDKIDASRFSFLDTDCFIENTEEPTKALREKENASIVIGLKALLKEEYDGLLSCGSTGALLAGGTLIVKRIKNVKRPALMIMAPSLTTPFILMDVGANVDCTVEMLSQFAVMGSFYAKGILGKENPSVALLNIGSEEGKGDKLRKETFETLRNSSINFIGNIEARDIYFGKADVVVTDGFTGNTVLKTTEGVSMVLGKVIQDAIAKNAKTQEEMILCKNIFGAAARVFDFNKYGSAPLLGLNKPVFKSHGSSDKDIIAGGISNLIQYLEQGTNEEIKNILLKEF